MKRSWVTAVVAAAAACAVGLASTLGAATRFETARVPGTRITLRHPLGFVPSEYGTMLAFPGTNAWIKVFEVKLSASKQISGAKKALAKVAKVLERKDVQVDSYKGFYSRVRLGKGKRRQVRWTLVFGDEKESVLIVASAPGAIARALNPIYRETLLSARWDRKYPVHPFEGLPFILPGKSILEFATRRGAELTFSREGRVQRSGPDDPVLVVSTVSARVPEEAQAEFCAAAVRYTGVFNDVKVLAKGEIQVDGMTGCELLARGVNRVDQRPGLIYQAVLFESDRYYDFKGIAGIRWRAQYVEEFGRMARRIKRR